MVHFSWRSVALGFLGVYVLASCVLYAKFHAHADGHFVTSAAQSFGRCNARSTHPVILNAQTKQIPLTPNGVCLDCDRISIGRSRSRRHRQCTLPLSQLFHHASNDLMMGGTRISIRSEPWRSCSAFELLAHVLAAAQIPKSNRSSACALQRELQLLRRSRSHRSTAATATRRRRRRRRRRLGCVHAALDCTEPPCCPSAAFICAGHPRANLRC